MELNKASASEGTRVAATQSKPTTAPTCEDMDTRESQAGEMAISHAANSEPSADSPSTVPYRLAAMATGLRPAHHVRVARVDVCPLQQPQSAYQRIISPARNISLCPLAVQPWMHFEPF